MSDIERMEGVVNQMLTLARVEEVRQSTAGWTDLADSIKEVVIDLESTAELKGIAILMHGELDKPARIEPEQFKLVCTNLLMNALQHGRAGSTIRIELKEDGIFARMAISDEGDGIPAGDIDRIFERFFRSDRSPQQRDRRDWIGVVHL